MRFLDLLLGRNDNKEKAKRNQESAHQSLLCRRGLRVRPFFRWYDLWIGVYVDTQSRSVYVCPIPMLGIKVWKYRSM